jgi:hypothetical protein
VWIVLYVHVEFRYREKMVLRYQDLGTASAMYCYSASTFRRRTSDRLQLHMLYDFSSLVKSDSFTAQIALRFYPHSHSYFYEQ